MELFEDMTEYNEVNREDDIDLEHLGLIKMVGREFIARGENIGQPFFADAWDYLTERTMTTPHNDNFQSLVKESYIDLINGCPEEGFIPSIADVADAVDERNMVIIHEFYKGEGYSSKDIDVILGNYVQEFSCMMEDWVETALQNLGCPYTGSSMFHYYEARRDYAPQNILLSEFLR